MGVLSLTVYMLGFSLAYLTLDTGLGALVLFGMVQLTMFAGGLLRGERLYRRSDGPARRIALSGLAVLLWPSGAAAPEPVGAVLMAAAGVGWGLYSLTGRGARDPLDETGGEFHPRRAAHGGAAPGDRRRNRCGPTRHFPGRDLWGDHLGARLCALVSRVAASGVLVGRCCTTHRSADRGGGRHRSSRRGAERTFCSGKLARAGWGRRVHRRAMAPTLTDCRNRDKRARRHAVHMHNK